MAQGRLFLTTRYFLKVLNRGKGNAIMRNRFLNIITVVLKSPDGLFTCKQSVTDHYEANREHDILSLVF